MTRELSKRLGALITELQQANPAYKNLKVSKAIRAYPKTPKGWSKHQTRIVAGLLSNSQFLRMTNEAIVEVVAGWYPGYAPSASIMSRPLYSSSRPAIEKLLREHGLAIVVRPEDTLSSLKKAIRAGSTAEDATASISGTVEISDDFVTANGVPYAVDKSRRHPSIRVTVGGKRQYVRCDALRSLLGESG